MEIISYAPIHKDNNFLSGNPPIGVAFPTFFLYKGRLPTQETMQDMLFLLKIVIEVFKGKLSDSHAFPSLSGKKNVLHLCLKKMLIFLRESLIKTTYLRRVFLKELFKMILIKALLEKVSSPLTWTHHTNWLIVDATTFDQKTKKSWSMLRKL